MATIITSQAAAAAKFEVHPRTIRTWIERGFIRGYLSGKKILVDVEEIERGFQSNPSMRDGRRKLYGANARLVILPVQMTEHGADE